MRLFRTSDHDRKNRRQEQQ